MSTVDLDILAEAVRDSVSVGIFQQFGDIGLQRLTELTAVLRRLYELVDPHTLRSPLVVAAPITASTACGMSLDEAGGRIMGGGCLTLVDRSRVAFSQSIPSEAVIAKLSSKAVIYRFDAGTEHFVIARQLKRLHNPLPECASVFSIPRFRKLGDALLRYARISVLTSGCEIFARAWADGRRLHFCNKPEKLMRRSLEQFLRHVLPDADVRPEQPVDESHPVDIRIVWRMSNSVALIEIKWLGASINKTKTKLLRYSESRAQEGANQLAQYLDDNLPKGAEQQTIGYLVVYDARRGNLRFRNGTTSSSKPAEFRNVKLVFDPDHAKTRADFAEPCRMYAEHTGSTRRETLGRRGL